MINICVWSAYFCFLLSTIIITKGCSTSSTNTSTSTCIYICKYTRIMYYSTVLVAMLAQQLVNCSGQNVQVAIRKRVLCNHADYCQNQHVLSDGPWFPDRSWTWSYRWDPFLTFTSILKIFIMSCSTLVCTYYFFLKWSFFCSK